jgi:hypothetical protein
MQIGGYRVWKNAMPELHEVTVCTKRKMYFQGTVRARCVLAAALRTVKLGLTELENQAKPLKYCHLWPILLYSIFLR